MVFSTSIFKRLYKGAEIAVVQGDITKQEVDAIVNPANSMLVMGGGVAGAILRAGGREIQDEASRSSPIPVGKAIATRAGRLKAKHVIHSPTMQRPAMGISAQNAKLATTGALNCARELRITSVAFPGMGTGVGGLGFEEAAEVMVEEIKRHIEVGTSLKKIVLVGFNVDLTQAFERALEKKLR